MRVALVTCAAAVLIAVVPFAVAARGEPSYSVPEVRIPVVFASKVVRAPVWSQSASVDPALTWTHDLLAIGDGAVVFRAGGRVCAFAGADGRRLWCAGAGGAPAYARGVFAYATSSDGIHAVHAATGAPAWRFAFPEDRVPMRGAPATTFSHAVWGAGDGFLIAHQDVGVGRGAPGFGEVSLAGRLRWTSENRANEPLILPPYALNRHVESGATMVATQDVVRLGPGGGVIAGIRSAWNVVEVRYPSVVVSGDQVEPMEDHFLTRDVWLADIRDGKIGAQFHYEPDYDANSERYFRNALPTEERAKDIGTEGDAVYIGVGPNVYRYRLADGAGQRPLLVSREGRFAGGPVRGAIFVARRDGVWSLRPRGRTVEARLIAPSAQPMTALTVAGSVAYVGTADGRVRGVNLDDDRIVFDAQPCRSDRIGSGPRRVYVICSGSTAMRVVAYPRP